MKKLMIAAFAVAFAAVAHAATVSWTATNVMLGNATDKASGIAYFMVTSMQDASAFTTGLTNADVKALVGNAYSWAPSTAGAYSVSSSAPVSNAALGLADTTAYTAYLVIFDGATIDDSSKFFVSNTKAFETYGGTSNINVGFMSQKTASQDPAGWTDIVPEPTSGLMLLVGLAGLALKRKVA